MLKIIFDNSRERGEHAKRLVEHHLRESDKKYPRIIGASLAKEIQKCECGNFYWCAPDDPRWECETCRPLRGTEKKGLGF